MEKTCKRCGFRAPEEWFVKSRKVTSIFASKNTGENYRQTVCPMCQQEVRDKKKWSNRWIVKARNAIYNHAKKYGMKPQEFVDNFGWETAKVAHMMQHDYENSCSYCHHLFKNMGHGLRDITLDVIHPELPPYFQTNVIPVCQTCNSSKGKRDGTSFGLHLQMVKKRQEFLKVKPKQSTFDF